jgi:hypothetical protein
MQSLLDRTFSILDGGEPFIRFSTLEFQLDNTSTSVAFSGMKV